MLAWTAPQGIAAGAMAWAGNFREFYQLNVVGAFSEVAGSAGHSIRFGPTHFLIHEGGRNPLFSALAILSLVWAVLVCARRIRGRSEPGEGDGLGFTLFLAVVLLASLWLNPFPFPYLHVTVLPTLAILIGAAGGRLAASRGLGVDRPGGIVLLIVLLAGALATSVPRLTYLASMSQDHQMETLLQVQRATGPEDAVFDMVGLYFRPDGHFAYLMTSQTLARYQQGMLERIPDSLRRTGTVAFLYNYRIRWLEGEDQRFLQEHFTHYDGNLFLLGTPLVDLGSGESRAFEVLVGKRFRHDGDCEILVDGRPFEEGFLAAGEHVIERVGEVAGDRLIMDSPGPHPWPPRPPEPLYVNFD
jgi:hypothetical protein